MTKAEEKSERRQQGICEKVSLCVPSQKIELPNHCSIDSHESEEGAEVDQLRGARS